MDMLMKSTQKIFLYGTLKPGQPNWPIIERYLMQGVEVRLTPATIRGNLYVDNETWLPFLTRGTGTVIGMLLETRWKALVNDMYWLEVPAGYHPQEVDIFVSGRGIEQGYAYGIHNSARDVESGKLSVAVGGIYNYYEIKARGGVFDA